MFGRAFHVQPTKNGYDILYGKVVFLQLKIGRMGLKSFLADFASDVVFLKKKDVRKKRKITKVSSVQAEKNEIRYLRRHGSCGYNSSHEE